LLIISINDDTLVDNYTHTTKNDFHIDMKS